MSELNTAKANLASAQSSLNYQSANMSRYQPLYKKGLVSADDVFQGTVKQVRLEATTTNNVVTYEVVISGNVKC